MKCLWVIPPVIPLQTMVDSLYAMPEHSVETAFVDNGLCDPFLIDPDIIIYSGATHGVHALSDSELRRIKGHAKMVLLCPGDPGWIPWMDRYAELNLFDLMVCINGNQNYVRRAHDLSLLSPVDPRPYEKQVDKVIALGFIGGLIPARQLLLDALYPFVTMGARNEIYGSHHEYVNWLKSCRSTLIMNFFDESRRTEFVHLKILEAGLAGNIVFEYEDSLTAQYFDPWVDYIPYRTSQDIINCLRRIHDFEAMPQNLRGKVMSKYSHRHFWDKVFERALN